MLRTPISDLKNFVTSAALRGRQLKVAVNGVAVHFPDTQPSIINGRIYVPVRFVAETIGAQIGWVQKTQQVSITRGHIRIVLHIGSEQMLRYENGLHVSNKRMDVAPLISEGRTILPIHFILEEFGCIVDWDVMAATVAIYDVPAKQPDAPDTSVNEALLGSGLTGAPAQEPDPVSAHGVVYQSSSDNFTFYAAKSSKRYIRYISIVLESAYKQFSREFGVTLNEKVAVRVYPSYRSYCEAIGKEFSPSVTHKQVFGNFKDGGDAETRGIYMTLPNSDILRDQENFYDKILLHELIHIFAEQITPTYQLQEQNLHWLIEGLADYKSGEIMREYAQALLKSEVAHNTLPSLSDLEIQDVAKFDAMGGYTYGASIIEFIDKKYGFPKVMELYKNPGEYRMVFGFPRDAFESQWKQFLMGNYS